MDGATRRIWSSDSGESLRNAGEWEAKRDASCMVFLLNKKAVEENRTPDSKIRSPAVRLVGAVDARNPVGPIATVFPALIPTEQSETSHRCLHVYHRHARRPRRPSQ